jgi:hypothetical protein
MSGVSVSGPQRSVAVEGKRQMPAIPGAFGQIGHELAVRLRRDFTGDIRLVSRTPVCGVETSRRRS